MKRIFLFLLTNLAAVAMLSVAGCGDEGSTAATKGAESSAADSRAVTRIAMQGVVSDFVRETVTEAEDAKTIFTDGVLDEELQAEIKRRNLAIETCSLLDCQQMKGRDYVGEMRNGAAAQLGWERFPAKTGGEPSPPFQFAGVLFRKRGMSDSVRRQGVVFAGGLALQILDVQEKNAAESLEDDELTKKFHTVQWRVARIARARALQERESGQEALAKRSLALADRLDRCNPVVEKIQLTPRDRLRRALRSADFKQAKEAAEQVLREAPEDVDANFAMGMWHFEQSQWADAERHLLKVKAAKPAEVAIWNNLAVLYLRMKRYDEAKAHADKALSLAPDFEAVKDTVKQVEKALGK